MSSTKKRKIEAEVVPSRFSRFLSDVNKLRKYTGESILDFKFNKKRVRVLSKVKEIPETCEGILYWMTREQRVEDNWSLLYAQKLALKNKVPLHVCFFLPTHFMGATLRLFRFMLKGLAETEITLKQLNIPFHFFLSNGTPASVCAEFVTELKIGAVVVDFSPLKIFVEWVNDLKSNLPQDVPLCQVDGHNLVPCWIASDKLEYGARTIRNKINSKLEEFLTEFPAVIQHPYKSGIQPKVVSWADAEAHLDVDRTVPDVTWAVPGYTGGMQVLFEFTEKRLRSFAAKNNDPTCDTLSNLSPWLHFGQISVQRCILHVRPFKVKYPDSVDVFCEQAIIRRELAENFCFYNPNYDSVEGAHPWAKKTLENHRKDKRTHVYSREEFEKSMTHDDLWNSAQIQLVRDGKMHGFLRLYWAKKILEWSDSPEEALRISLYLNDRFSLDGRDPNGFVGCMFCICGVHDQGWKEREVFGKIRYMNYAGCKRKFDVTAFVAKYRGQVHGKHSAP